MLFCLIGNVTILHSMLLFTYSSRSGALQPNPARAIKKINLLRYQLLKRSIASSRDTDWIKTYGTGINNFI